MRFAGNLVAGTNILAFQAMNSSTGGSDLILLPELTVEFRDLNASDRRRLLRRANARCHQ